MNKCCHIDKTTNLRNTSQKLKIRVVTKLGERKEKIFFEDLLLLFALRMRSWCSATISLGKMQYHSKNVEEKREKNVFINNNFSNKYQYLNKQHTWEKSLDKKWKEEFCQFLFNSKFIYFCMLLRPSNIDYMPITFQIDFFRHTHAHAVVDAPWQSMFKEIQWFASIQRLCLQWNIELTKCGCYRLIKVH